MNLSVIITRLCIPLSFFAFVACSSDPTEEVGGEVPGPSPDPIEQPFQVNNAIMAGMVIQQEKPFTAWGKGTTNETVAVTVSWSGETKTATVGYDGYWSVVFDVPQAPAGNLPQTVAFKYSKISEPIPYSVLIGEVWLISGQSNMQMEMEPNPGGHEGPIDWETEIAAADHPLLRFFASGNTPEEEPQWNPAGRWRICSPETAGKLSAVGYFFGRKLVTELNVPVGIIASARGGMSGQAYASREMLEANPVLKAAYVDPYVRNPSLHLSYRPSISYNAQIYPFLPFSIRGVLWYQGEANAGIYSTTYAYDDKYALLEKAKIEDWRRSFGDGTDDFSYYYAQIAPASWNFNKPESEAQFMQQYGTGSFYYAIPTYARFRELQATVRDQNANCEMVVTMDVGDPDDVHPRRKKEVGERFAFIALNRDYGRSEVAYLGPRYKSHTIDKGYYKVKFDHVLEGLATSDGLPPKHFMIGQEAGTFKMFYYPESVEVKGTDEVWVKIPSVVTSPASLRYAYLPYPETNLQNSGGLPAEPFRTDSWNSNVRYSVPD